MLVITRKSKENLLIGKDISITVIDIRSDQVKIGVEAPPEVRVVRGELLGEVCQLNRSAARIFPSQLAGLKLGGGSPAQCPTPTLSSQVAPDVYLEVQGEDLQELCASYKALGFRLVEGDLQGAWLQRSGVWLRCTVSDIPCRELRLAFSSESTSHAAPAAAVAAL